MTDSKRPDTRRDHVERTAMIAGSVGYLLALDDPHAPESKRVARRLKRLLDEPGDD